MRHGNRTSPGYPFLQSPAPLAFAHRGGAGEAEENTLAAFARAVALGYRYIETDIQATRDGVAVVFHDAELTRLTDGRGTLAEMTWSEVAGLRTRGGAGLCRLDALFEEWPAVNWNLDPKTDAAIEPMAETIRRCGALDRVCVGSFEDARIARLQQLFGPRLCVSAGPRGVARVWTEAWGRLPAGRYGFAALQVPPRHRGLPVVTRRLVDCAHRRGLQVHVWTIDDEAEMERLLDLGVDGLMTDRPSLMKRVLQRRGQWTGP